MEKVELEGTLDRVETIRKKDGVVGKVIVVWDVRDFTKITKLSQMQNATVRVLIEDPQQDLFDRSAHKAQEELEFGEDDEPIDDHEAWQEDKDETLLLPESADEITESIPVENEE